MFERGEIKSAVNKAQKFRKAEQKEHDYQTKLRDNAQIRAEDLEYKIQEAEIQLAAEETTSGEAHTIARDSAKKIIAIDNLTKDFLCELDLVETGTKKPDTG